MKNSKNLSVLITGIGGGSTGEGLIKTLKMAQTSYRIVAVDVLPISIGFFDVDSYHQVPPASADNYLEKILEICRLEKIDIVIPGSEPELKKMSENREFFQREGIFLLVNSKEIISLCMDKWRTYEFLKKNGFLCPTSYIIEKEEQINQLLPEIEKIMPVIIKPIRGGGASVNAFVAQDKEELLFFIQYLLKQDLVPMIQEYVGIPTEEYTIGVLTNFKGELIDSIALRRQILSGLSSKIKIKNRCKNKINSEILAISSGYSQGMIDDYKDIRQVAEKIALELKSAGPINIQGRKTEKGFYVFEINPRFSGTTVMRAIVGFNEPDILIRNLIFKEEIRGSINYKTGIIPRGLREKYISFDNIKNISL